VAWLEEQLANFEKHDGVKLRNVSDETGAVAVQGPRVAEFINRCFPGPFTGGTGVTLATDLKKNKSRRPGAKDSHLDFAHGLYGRRRL